MAAHFAEEHALAVLPEHFKSSDSHIDAVRKQAEKNTRNVSGVKRGAGVTVRSGDAEVAGGVDVDDAEDDSSAEEGQEGPELLVDTSVLEDDADEHVRLPVAAAGVAANQQPLPAARPVLHTPCLR